MGTSTYILTLGASGGEWIHEVTDESAGRREMVQDMIKENTVGTIPSSWSIIGMRAS
jgi:hypothetical protein